MGTDRIVVNWEGVDGVREILGGKVIGVAAAFVAWHGSLVQWKLPGIYMKVILAIFCS